MLEWRTDRLQADASGLLPTRQARLPIPSRPVTEADLKLAARRIEEGAPGMALGGVLVEAPPRWSTASSALFAEDGSLWIKSVGHEGSGELWQVFPADGSSVRVLQMPGNFEPRAVNRELMYGVSRSANGADKVRIFEWRLP